MGNPWLKFYPSDWRADPSLRMCSIAARGLWMEMLCVMHEAEPQGFLLVNGKALTCRQLATLAGVAEVQADNLLIELEEAGVFSRDEDNTIYSRRIRRDVEKADRDKANGGKGGNPTLKGGVNPFVNGWDKAQKPESRSQKLEKETRAERALSPEAEKAKLWAHEFNTLFWPGWINKVGKPPAERAWFTARKSGTSCEAIIAGRDLYQRDKPADRPWLNPATFLNQRRFDDQPASANIGSAPIEVDFKSRLIEQAKAMGLT